MSVTAEGAVRDYLTALRNPQALRDEERIAELSRQLDAADDPVQRLLLRSELDRAQAPNVERYETDFITHAKKWATEHQVPATVFEQEGVPRDVLRKAGLTGTRRGGQKAAATRRPRVSRDDVIAAIPSRRKFTIADLAEKSGASTATVRKVVTDLVGTGELAEAGITDTYNGRGRAPTVYKRAGK